MRDRILSVAVEDGELKISIGVDTLSFAIEMDDATITNADAFATALAEALSEESEDGTTPVHLLLDAAAQQAIGNGCEGVELVDGSEEAKEEPPSAQVVDLMAALKASLAAQGKRH